MTMSICGLEVPSCGGMSKIVVSMAKVRETAFDWSLKGLQLNGVLSMTALEVDIPIQIANRSPVEYVNWSNDTTQC
jgi:hypothetical protein